MKSLRQSALGLNPNFSLRNTSIQLKAGDPPSLAALVAAHRIDSYHKKAGGIHGDYGIAVPGISLQRGMPKFTRLFRGGPLLYDYHSGGIDAIFTWKCRIRHQGIKCFDETDELSASDEIYTITTVYNPDLTNEMKPQSIKVPESWDVSYWENIDEGDVVKSSTTLWTGAPQPLVIHTSIWEHDEGSPEEIRQKFQDYADDITKITQDDSASKFVDLLKTTFVGGWISDFFGLGDNPVGEDLLTIEEQDWYDIVGPPKEWHKIDDATVKANLDAKFPPGEVNGHKYRLETDPIKGLGGEYRAYFDIKLQRMGPTL